MSVNPDSDLPQGVLATLPAAEERAAEAWTRLLQDGSSFGAHPLNGLIDGAPGQGDHQSGAA